MNVDELPLLTWIVVTYKQVDELKRGEVHRAIEAWHALPVEERPARPAVHFRFNILLRKSSEADYLYVLRHDHDPRVDNDTFLPTMDLFMNWESQKEEYVDALNRVTQGMLKPGMIQEWEISL